MTTERKYSLHKHRSKEPHFRKQWPKTPTSKEQPQQLPVQWVPVPAQPHRSTTRSQERGPAGATGAHKQPGTGPCQGPHAARHGATLVPPGLASAETKVPLAGQDTSSTTALAAPASVALTKTEYIPEASF